MAIFTDSELVSKLLSGTEEGRLDWQKTATEEQYAVSVGGKWTVLVDRSTKDESSYWLSLNNSEGEEILTIYGFEEARVARLFELAKRHALKVNQAIADVIQELDK